MEGILDSWVDGKRKKKKKGREKRKKGKKKWRRRKCFLLRDSIRLCARVRLFMNNERVVIGLEITGECGANCFVGKRQ